MAFTFIKHGTQIDFIGQRFIAYGISLVLLLAGLASALWGNGIKLGIDFAGGVIVQVQFQKPIIDEDLKKILDSNVLPDISIQSFGESGRDYLLRLSTPKADAAELRARTSDVLKAAFPDNAAEIQRLEVVGPKVGADLTNKALAALYYAILLMAVYISGRFEQRWMASAIMAAALWGGMYLLGFTGLGMGYLVMLALGITLVVCFFLKLNFAFGAVVGLLHDVLVTVGLLSFMNVEIDLNVLAAIMTLIGYSINDTIIIYDRLRENLRSSEKLSFADLINKSVNQTLSRTILTSGTTLLAAASLFVFGGGVIHDFAVTMLIGIIVGTASSVYVASAILLVLGDTEFYRGQQEKLQKKYERPGEHGVV
ncbi:MAG: protein translocase subunit SecF [Desulfovibrio sp.]|jgi:preprotein translocase subunit SecF|nr:protein translocase subunit SecF [Desulfovibrio sp.]